MRILIDTNILIPLEDTCGILCSAYSELSRLAAENGYLLTIHSGSLEDLNRDKDSLRKQSLLAKAKKYPLLESPPIPNADELNELGLTAKTDNDRIDNLLLFAMHRSAAHILVTEDREIHAKAKRLGISNQVHYVLQTVNFIKKLHRKVDVSLPDVEHLPLHNIDYRQPFFDSLREGYRGEFDEWYRKCSIEGRKAWVVFDGEVPSAILIYKTEVNEHISEYIKLDGKSLKLCTFKVGETYRGRKLGELLIKMAFEHAIQNSYNHIYVTIRQGAHEHLRDLCEDFGFYNIGLCDKKRDDVYAKFIPTTAPTTDLGLFEYYRKYHPFFKCGGVSKYIVPIIPKYHKVLFPDIHRKIDRQLFHDSSTAPGNAIKKEYICHAQINSMNPGDIVMFYRSSDIKSITTIGIVEKFVSLTNIDEIIPIVSKRTVYSRDEIVEFCVKPTKIIFFRQIKHFDRMPPIHWLNSNGISGNIQSIRKISDESFKLILEYDNNQNCS